ncbi:unnamed protein product [Vicia faba]|uniref:Leucine-rich repeat-containing N-terminal plant-type domain-containing protein n=1 Tax=Vicia faba TaxID=3906 RepID=A0AAV0YLT6_VICFA|nr:unnamed protein product [Vicia faba]
MKWFLVCLHLFFFHFPSFSSLNFLCHQDENYALLEFRKTTTWKNGSDCCSWHGVTCDTISGHVIGINLACEGLQGEVPPQISHLSKLTSLHLSYNYGLVWKESTLKRLVQNATNLKEMFLDYTDMSSIKINSFDLLFNHSSSLVTLSLQTTGLRGNFKRSILYLPAIHELYMSGNHLRGQLPDLSSSIFLKILDFSNIHVKGPIPPSFSNLTHLTSLSLMGNSLNGSIPSSLLTLPCLTSLDLSVNNLSGQIPNIFHQSHRLQKLDLSHNKIGGDLPISLSNLHHLTSLSLSSNSFKGQIPNVFEAMTKLQHLSLYSNNLEAQIPSSLFNLNQLLTLDCSYNKLVGPLPIKIPGFQKLTYLNLDNNLLNGTISSSLLSLPYLTILSLSNNRLTGHISAISSYSLQELYLCANKLQGNIPKSIFKLSNLTTLCLSSNNFSGALDFQHFSILQNLRSLSLSHNSQLSLNIESNFSYIFVELTTLELSSLSLSQLPKFLGKPPSFYSLDMSNNKLNGRVPNWLLETINSLGFLNLSQNMFTSIDHSSRSGYQISYLDLSYNLLQGELSASICNMSSLEFLNLAHNKLTGIIPQCLVSLSSLQVLDLQMNKFYGNLPNKFSKESQLLTLNLYGNHLEECLPKTLSHCKNLEVLNLGSNRIEDKFPNWLQTLENLKVLVLRDNKFHGPISNLRIKSSFPSLIIFDISGNDFSGSLPKAYFKKLEAMKDEDASFSYMAEALYYVYSQLSSTWYYYSVTMTIKGIDSTLGKISTNFAIIDMSRNKFEGEISNVVGELRALKGLNLSHNRLTGIIPRSIGNLTNLESLDLSSNMITAVIPAELSDLNFLEFLNLSDNHLVGEIPRGKQFNTFSNDSYEGNFGLCGFPLTKKCGPEQHSPPSPNMFSSEERFGFGWKPVAIGYGCGFVFGIGLGYFMFLFGKPRWLVIIFGGQPKRRVRRRTRVRRTNGSNMNQMIQMS